MRKLAIAFLLAASVLSLAGCKVADETSRYFADFDDLLHGNKAEAAPTEGSSQDSGTQSYTLTVICLDYKAITVTVDSDDPELLPDPVEFSLQASSASHNSFYEVPNLKGGAYTMTVSLGEANFDFQFDPSQTPTLLVVVRKASDSTWDVRLVPMGGSALAPLG